MAINILTKKQVIVRIAVVFAVVELMVMILFTYLPEVSPGLEAILDAMILVLTATPLIYFGVIRPYIIANSQLIDRINRLVFLDELTQLGNRRALLDHYSRFISTNVRQKSYGAVFSLDLDLFKRVNDEYGHAAGDFVLIEVSKRLTLMIRKENIVCRVGGDEFVILVSMIDADCLWHVKKQG